MSKSKKNIREWLQWEHLPHKNNTHREQDTFNVSSSKEAIEWRLSSLLWSVWFDNTSTYDDLLN